MYIYVCQKKLCEPEGCNGVHVNPTITICLFQYTLVHTHILCIYYMYILSYALTQAFAYTTILQTMNFNSKNKIENKYE